MAVSEMTLVIICVFTLQKMNNGKESHNVIIKQLLRETLVMLCKNTLGYRSELSIEGLLGLTLDQNEVILVSISETISKDSSELNGGDSNSNEPQSEVSANLVEQTVSVQPDLKTRKKSTKKAREFKLSTANSCAMNGESYDANVMLPVDGKNSGDSVRIQVDFDFEKIEVKDEGNMASNQYRGCTYERNLELEDQEAEQQRSTVDPDYENDCYIESAGISDVRCNGYMQSNFQNIQNEASVLEHSVDSFMSLDQNIFQEVLQTDFSSSSLTYNIEGLSSGGFEVPARPKVDRQVCRRQRAAFGKADDRLVTGMRHRRGYMFHCRYGYTRILHQCSQCGATFTMSSNLGRHMATMHKMSGCDQSVLCPMCQKRFSRSDNLARHLKKVHKCDSPHLTLMSTEDLTD